MIAICRHRGKSGALRWGGRERGTRERGERERGEREARERKQVTSPFPSTPPPIHWAIQLNEIKSPSVGGGNEETPRGMSGAPASTRGGPILQLVELELTHHRLERHTEEKCKKMWRTPVALHGSTAQRVKGDFIELMTSDCKLEASREGST
jgi:hypothetical protein